TLQRSPSGAEDVERVAGVWQPIGQLPRPAGGTVHCGQCGRRVHADERPPREGAARLGRFEQERAGAPAGQLAIDADRRLPVGEQGARERHEAMRLGQFAQFGAGDRHALTASAPASKQVRSPVWQATPTWSTLTSTASPSQSSATDLTSCALPDVSPLTQYCCRERDQYVAPPVGRVRCKASSSLPPTTSTPS